METVRIEIVNKKARKLLRNMAELNLINIQEGDPKKAFQNLINKLRSKKGVPSLEEITKEVEFVRAKRYGKKG